MRPVARFSRAWILWWGSAALLLQAGCLTPQAESRPAVIEAVPVHNDRELRERLGDFVEYVQSSIEETSAQIERKSSEKDVRQAAALWRIRITQESRNALDQDDAREVLIDLWTLCCRLHDYLAQGEGKSIFGASQPLAVDCSDRIVATFEKIAQEFVPASALADLRRKVTTYSQSHPIRGRWDTAAGDQLSDHPEVNRKLGDLVALPFAPLTAIAAAGRTPDSIHDAAMSVRRFAEVVGDLPASTRWELQLLGMSLDESPTVAGSVASFKTLSESSAQFASNSAQFVKTLDNLPEKTRKEAETLLRTIDGMDGVNRTVTDAGQAAAAVEHAAYAVTEASREILKFVPSSMKDATGQIIGDNGTASGSALPSPGKQSETATSTAPAPVQDTSFSFQAVTESAVQLANTTDKLRSLLADTQQFVESGTVDATTAQMQALVDHATKRLIQLLLLAFGLAIVFLLTSARLRRRVVKFE